MVVVTPSVETIPSYYKLEDMWQKPGDNAKLPKFQAGYGKGVLSSRWLMPNDYLRLKNLTLGFSAPKEWISNLGLSKARVYFSANNLLTWKSKDLLLIQRHQWMACVHSKCQL